jgi:rhodanese-related sulfurtransferase
LRYTLDKNSFIIKKAILALGMPCKLLISLFDINKGSQYMSYTKTIITAVLLMLIVPLVATGCNAVAAPVVNEVISTQTAYKMIQGNQDNPNFVVVDVRTQEEFNAGHIAKAVIVDYESQDFNAKISELDRNKKYLVYCRTARRSGLAVKVMKDLGFREVYDMAKGINQWKTEGLPVVSN